MRRVGDAGKHEVDDVVGQVVLAVGDEGLLAEEPEGSILGALRLGGDGTELGARLRLGQIHGHHPFARDELGQVTLLEVFGCVGEERMDGAAVQHRADSEGGIGPVPDLLQGHLQHHRQALSAPFGRAADPVPAGFAPAPVRLLPAWRHGDDAVGERNADAVAGLVQGSKLIFSEPAGFLDDRVGCFLVEIGKGAGGDQAVEPAVGPQCKRDFSQRCGTAHE